MIDRLWGGPGLRRGRRNPHDLQLGDAVDFWRVEEIVDGELLRLRAEMKVPGPGLARPRHRARRRRRARCSTSAPCSPRRACSGGPYWWSVWPFHGLVFGGMQRNIAAGRGAGERRGRRWRPSGRQRRRTVVVTATIDGRRGAELNPKRTGGSTSVSAPRSTPSHVAIDGVDAVPVGGRVELVARRRSRRACGRRAAATRATGSTTVAHAGSSRARRGHAPQRPPERVAPPERDVGDERSAGERAARRAGGRRVTGGDDHSSNAYTDAT